MQFLLMKMRRTVVKLLVCYSVKALIPIFATRLKKKREEMIFQKEKEKGEKLISQE